MMGAFVGALGRIVVWGLVASFAALPAAAADKVRLRLDWSTIGYHSPFYLAAERGYYRDAGLEVDIQEGKGSGNTVQLVGNGADTFGYADASVAAKSASQGVPIKVVMGIIRKGPASIAFPLDGPIKKPADLKGKTIISCPGHAALIFLPAYLKANGMAMSDVKVTTVDCGSLFPLLAQGKADAATGFTPGSISNLARAGMTKVGHLDYAQAGIVLPSHGIVASTKTIEGRPDLVRRFVAATAKGWQEALKDSDAAIKATVKARPLIAGSEAIFKTELIGYGEYINTPGTAGKPFGWQSADEWKAAEKLMVEYMDMKPAASTDAYFTNAFVGAN